MVTTGLATVPRSVWWRGHCGCLHSSPASVTTPRLLCQGVSGGVVTVASCTVLLHQWSPHVYCAKECLVTCHCGWLHSSPTSVITPRLLYQGVSGGVVTVAGCTVPLHQWPPHVPVVRCLSREREILGPVSWWPTTVKWRQFSQSNRHFTIDTRQTWVSWSVTIVGERRGEVWLHIRWR